MSELINPYAPPAAEIVSPAGDPLRTGAILSRAWLIFRERFVVIAVTVMLVWVPCELLSSYMDAFVFGEDDLRKSFKFSQFLDNIFGIIATAGVIHVALHQSTGTPSSIGQAFAAGISNWPRMWWTRFLTNIVLILSMLLVVVPFFYLYPRLALADSVVVSEGLSGNAAMKRSQDLVRGRYWQVTGILFLLLVIFCIPLALLIGLSAFSITPDHWIADAATGVVLDITSGFVTVCLFCMYEAFSQQEESSSGKGSQTVQA